MTLQKLFIKAHSRTIEDKDDVELLIPIFSILAMEKEEKENEYRLTVNGYSEYLRIIAIIPSARIQELLV